MIELVLPLARAYLNGYKVVALGYIQHRAVEHFRESHDAHYSEVADRAYSRIQKIWEVSDKKMSNFWYREFFDAGMRKAKKKERLRRAKLEARELSELLQ